MYSVHSSIRALHSFWRSDGYIEAHKKSGIFKYSVVDMYLSVDDCAWLMDLGVINLSVMVEIMCVSEPKQEKHMHGI